MNLEEAIVAPVAAPRVLDQPVVHVVFSAIADRQDSVVHISLPILARSRTVHPRRVGTKVIDDLEGDGDRLLVDGRLQFDFIACGDVDCTRTSHVQSEVSCLHSARAVLCEVGVRVFTRNPTGTLDVLEGVRGQTTVATEVIVVTRTIHKLLL